jgi:hypothetical protein
MPQATDEQRDLMRKWFGDPIDSWGPMQFLLSHGFTCDEGRWRSPVPHHNTSEDEYTCLQFLIDEWDHAMFVRPLPLYQG